MPRKEGGPRVPPPLTSTHRCQGPSKKSLTSRTGQTSQRPTPIERTLSEHRANIERASDDLTSDASDATAMFHRCPVRLSELIKLARRDGCRFELWIGSSGERSCRRLCLRSVYVYVDPSLHVPRPASHVPRFHVPHSTFHSTFSSACSQNSQPSFPEF